MTATSVGESKVVQDNRQGPRFKRALLIQSHVVHGYVGNKAATFPLQYRGWDIDALNSVQYSNHPGYGFFSGFQSSNRELSSILKDGLTSEGLDVHYDAILTGYLPKGELLHEMGMLVGKLVRKQPSIRWILDPVLGDNGKLYVEQSTVDVVKQLLSDPENKIYLTTPNQFEMEMLSGVAITNLETLVEAFHKFHELYPRVERIVVTSIILPDHRDEYVSALWDTTSDKTHPAYYAVHRIETLFFGSGDLLTALLMDALDQTSNLSIAVGKALWLVLQVLKRTHDNQPHPTPPTIKDLQLIQCRDLWRLEWSQMPCVNVLESLESV